MNNTPDPHIAFLSGLTGRYKIAALSALAFICGAVMVAAMPPWHLWPALMLGFSGFYLLLARCDSARTSFLYGWGFGFGYFLCSLSWIANALLVEGNDFSWVWPLAIAGLPAGLALFYGFAAMAVSRLTARYGGLGSGYGYSLFIAIFMIAEWLRGHIFTGFPWNLYGYSLAHSDPLSQLAAYGGVYWLSLLSLCLAALPGFLMIWQQRTALKAGILCGVIILVFTAIAGGQYRLARYPATFHDDLVVRLVQPNIAQEDKWRAEMATANLRTLLDLSTARMPDTIRPYKTLIIWPETAITDFALQNENASTAILRMLESYDGQATLLSGVLRYQDSDDHRHYFNSLVAYDTQLQPLHVFDKAHLVPFGEYVPFGDILSMVPFVNHTGFVAGDGLATAAIDSVPPYSPLVCYEIIFPGKAVLPGDRPQWIVNVTNDAWYGDSGGPRQHFTKARFRAIEEGLPVVRSANTGISGVIDPLGRVVHNIPLMTRAAPDIALPRPLPHVTLFARYGNLLFWATLLLLLLPVALHEAQRIRRP